jgi:hypothetical protein
MGTRVGAEKTVVGSATYIVLDRRLTSTMRTFSFKN